MMFDVIAVADGPRISLGVALNIVVSRKTCPKARFCVALPEDARFESAVAEQCIREFAGSIVRIPSPKINVEGHLYRIENKVNAFQVVGTRRAILVDSDVLFLRPLPIDFLERRVPAAVPEHSSEYSFPWARMYATLGLVQPTIKVLSGSGHTCDPWFNAGFVIAPNGEQLSSVWRMMCEFLLRCDWVPDRWPYLDQIALPLAFAQLSPTRSVGYDNVLPARFNQNMFYWEKEQGHILSGFVAHHHNRVKLLETYFPHLITWTADEYPVVRLILDELRQFDRDE